MICCYLASLCGFSGVCVRIRPHNRVVSTRGVYRQNQRLAGYAPDGLVCSAGTDAWRSDAPCIGKYHPKTGVFGRCGGVVSRRGLLACEGGDGTDAIEHPEGSGKPKPAGHRRQYPSGTEPQPTGPPANAYKPQGANKHGVLGLTALLDDDLPIGHGDHVGLEGGGPQGHHLRQAV